MKKILVIEDDYNIRSSIVSALEETGYNVFSAGDGNSGLKLAMELSPDLVLCDIMMPGISGHQVFEEIKTNSKYPIPFIYLTAKSDMQDLREGMQRGADDYIIKPFRIKDLLESIRIRLERISDFKESQGEDSDENQLSYKQSIFLRDLKQPKFIQIQSIVLVMANGDLTTLFLDDGSRINTRKSVSNWEKVLPEKYFYRTHRRFIVNSNYIEKVEPWFKRSYRIVIEGIDENVFISERYASRLKKLLP